MRRRDFVFGVVGSVCTALAGSHAAGQDKESPARIVHSTLHEVGALQVGELTVADIAASYAFGTLSARSLTQSYLDRIEALNHRGPRLGSV